MEILNAPDVTTAKGLRDRAIIVVARLCAAPVRGGRARRWVRCSGGFTPEATVAARWQANVASAYGSGQRRTMAGPKLLGRVVSGGCWRGDLRRGSLQRMTPVVWV